MRTRWAMPQFDHASRVLEHLAIVAHQRCARFVPKHGPMLKTVEAIQGNVLQIGAIQLATDPREKTLTNSVLPVRDGPSETKPFSSAATISSPRQAVPPQ